LLIPLIVLHFGQWSVPRFNIAWPKIAALLLGLLSLFYFFTLLKTTPVWRDNFTLYTETLKRSPDATVMADNLARYYFDRRQNEEAAYWLSRAQGNLERSFIKSERALVANYVRFAAVLLREKKMDEAFEYLQKGYKADPGNPAVLQNLGTVCIANKDYAQARKWFEAALAINPRNEISYNNLAYISLQENQTDKAIEYARKALEIFPNYGDAHLNLARGYAAKGLVEQASESYRNAKIHNPQLESAIESELQALRAAGKNK
jgi:Tfp pilus assembly protein PilF